MSALPHIVVSHEGSAIIFSPVGEFDISTVEMLRSTIHEAISPTHRHVVIDLSRTLFLDSMTLGVMIGVSKRARGWGGSLRLVGPRPNVRKALSITGLDRSWGLYDSVDQSLLHAETPDRGTTVHRLPRLPRRRTGTIGVSGAD
jgi:anti-sigma B factor antagonist